MVDLSSLFRGEGLAVRGMTYLNRCTSRDKNISKYGQIDTAELLCEPLRRGIMDNDIVSGIFQLPNSGV
jgi:hypothetical protein